jgi:hypothetical protein
MRWSGPGWVAGGAPLACGEILRSRRAGSVSRGPLNADVRCHLDAAQQSVALAAQIALLGEVPASLRFVEVKLDQGTLWFRAVFDSSATDDHLECASVVCAEIIAACPSDTVLEESIEIDSAVPWPRSEYLVFLRHGELSDT